VPATAPGNDESDSDVPLAASKLSKEKAQIMKEENAESRRLEAEDKKAVAAKKRKSAAVKKEEESDDSDAPLAKGKRRAAPAKKANGVKKEESSDDDVPLAKKPRATKAVATKATAAKSAAVKKEPAVKKEAKGKGRAKKSETPATTAGEGEEEEEEEYKWWEHQAETDGTVKWTTLEHNGVLFPPPYEPLPSDVKMLYNGVPITLPVEAEEVAGFFGAMIETTHAKNPKFVENFFKDFQEVIKESGGAKNPEGKVRSDSKHIFCILTVMQKIPIKDFAKCDFTPMFNYFEAKKAEKKTMTAAEKKALKAEKEEAEKKYQYCLLDGRKEKVGNFRIEPPGLFRGRGDHPKTGKVKKRVQPEQVTINIGPNAPVPQPPPGHKWGGIQHDDKVTWLATWKENINGNIKYVMLAANSSLKGMSDYKKFEKARELKKHIGRIREDYTKEFRSIVMADRQRATAMYLIDVLALRAGNEKGEDEADTVGCCSLRYEHVTLEPPNKVVFDFLGKDSIRYHDTVEVTPQVFKNIKIFKKAPKGPGDMIFDRLNTTDLNKHLQSYMPGLSAKVFRTYNASFTMQREMKKIPNEGSVHDKYAAYNEANRMVAILCNHQRTVSTTHEASLQKAADKIKALRYQKLRLKRQILFLDPKRKKKDPEFFKPDPDIDDEEWIKEHQNQLIEQEREKITKKFEKENEKLVAEGEKEQKESVLKERLQVLKEMADEFKKENKTGTVEPKSKSVTIEKLEANIEKMDERIRKQEIEVKVKDDNKTVALGTSKIVSFSHIVAT
jgi:DNA topoisomerase-1